MLLEDRLAIQLITYNRCEYLHSTLSALIESPFKECTITVIDNCSTDETGNIVSCFQEQFPDLRYHHNRVNIGGDANYLKAVELSSAEYTWILCDDDFFDFSDCDDVIASLVTGGFDCIDVGSTAKEGWTRGVATTSRDMVARGLPYHFRLSFFPALIFRTALFDNVCFSCGFRLIARSYPQFEFLNKSIRDNFSIYISRRRLVLRNDVNDLTFLPLAWYAAWVSCCITISDRRLRSRAISDVTSYRGFFRCLTFWTIMDRKMDDGRFWRKITDIMLALDNIQRLKYLLVLPLALIPFPFAFWIWVRKILYRLMKVPETEIPSLRLVNRD